MVAVKVCPGGQNKAKTKAVMENTEKETRQTAVSILEYISDKKKQHLGHLRFAEPGKHVLFPRFYNLE